MATGELKHLARFHGASVVGVCRVGDLVENFHPEIRETAAKLPFAVSIGIALQPIVLKTLIDRPNFMYKSHYRSTNTQLDNVTYKIAQWIGRAGFNALPIPASMVLQRYPMIGHVNHREIAHAAGLGWQGKNNLLISHQFGARLRLTTLLTDLELVPDEIDERDCGKCKACVRKCPAGAIGDSPEDFDLQKCRDQVVRFSKENNFGLLICGLCLNCCPTPKKGSSKNGQTIAS